MEDAFGAAPRVLRDDGRLQRTLHPGLTVELFADEGEGYFSTSPAARRVVRGLAQRRRGCCAPGPSR